MCVCVCVCVCVCGYIYTSLQVIVEKVPKSSIPDIDKKKFLVPADLSGEMAIVLASLS